MDAFTAPDYALGRLVLVRGLGVVYLIAFVSALNQFRALIGARGLLPVPRFLARVSWKQMPSLFHLGYSDRLFAGVCWVGILLSMAVVAGLPQRAPVWVGVVVWLTLWALYLSIVNVGQTFYGFGWESILLEAGFFAAFLGPAHLAPPVITLFCFRWLLFRVEFGAGLIKLRGDRCWRDLTCLDYHHETQPIPNPLSWYFHHLPKPLHRLEVAGNHLTQLVVPFALFLPQPVAGAAACLIVLTQSYLLLSGNFAWLNALTLVLAFSAVPDAWLAPVLPGVTPVESALPPAFLALTVAVGVLVLVLSWRPVQNLLSPRQRMNIHYNPFHLVGSYGAFGSVTRTRHELVIEGTRDPDPETATWRSYAFKAKPGDPLRRPRQVAPYHLRLDWLMWFVPLSPPAHDHWFFPLLRKLLEGDPATLALMADDPFPEGPPRWIRVGFWRYRFTTPAERRETGAWWWRTPEGVYVPFTTLGDGGRLVMHRDGGVP